MRHTASVHPLAAALASLLVALPAQASGQAPAASGAPAGESLDLAWEVVSRRPHDVGAWTQGLQLDEAGRLFESTGKLGRSTLREVDPASGAVLRSVSLPDDHFGEGLAIVGDRLIQLTWTNGVAAARDADTFAPVAWYAYEGEGWGLCFDGQRLVMSDGSDRLTFRDAATFEVLGDVVISHDLGWDLRLNELECVDGQVWANAYLTDTIVRIDSVTGELTGTLDLAGIHGQALEDEAAWDVLNGIAYDPVSDTYLVTGKLWPELFEIRITDQAPDQVFAEPAGG